MNQTTTAYNPNYDPLRDTLPGTNQAYAPTYWYDTAGTPPASHGQLTQDIETDVAIIGGGFTGLATAMFLAQEHHIHATVLEANQLGWGCTSRNGGQGHLAWGRLSRSQWIKRWGVELAKQLHANTLEGFEVFRTLTKHPEIDCEPVDQGHLLIAHSPKAYAQISAESTLCQRVFGYQTRILPSQQLKQHYVNDQESYGALLEPEGIAVHPLKLAYGYAKLALQGGAKIHTGSPVQTWRQEGSIHYLHTPAGIVKARTVIIATAGYTSANLHPLTAYRMMPIMANSAVTRVLHNDEIAACGFQSRQFMTDTRKLRYYYRLLPDNRLQIGTRSAISGHDAENPKHFQMVQQTIANKFPALKNIEIPWFWHGWMDISHDMMPRIVQPEPAQQIFYAQGYSGNGVAFSAYAAWQLAQLAAGKQVTAKHLPIFQTPLPKHPLRPLRRAGQHVLFAWYKYLDNKQ